jgi:hypothetical protein
MQYDLLKKLKDAGFPQIILCEREDEHKRSECGECDCEHYPTLSELIEACGEEFEGLDRDRNSDPDEDDEVYFSAKAWKLHKNSIGSTPEEAVSNLWIELNKK